MIIPIPFVGWLEIDEEDTQQMLRDQIRAQQAEIANLNSRINDALAWMDLKEWNSVDREILLEVLRGKKVNDIE